MCRCQNQAVQGIPRPMVLRIAAQQDAQVLKLSVINTCIGVNQAQPRAQSQSDILHVMPHSAPHMMPVNTGVTLTVACRGLQPPRCLHWSQSAQLLLGMCCCCCSRKMPSYWLDLRKTKPLLASKAYNV